MQPVSSRNQRRLERIKNEIPILQVLVDFGYPVHPGAGDREQQFPCDLHGDRQDSKPSARVYPYSSTFYCFACGKVRDALELVREKLGLSFNEAMSYLENKYDLPSMTWESGDAYVGMSTVEADILKTLNPDKTFSDDIKMIYSVLDFATKDKMMSMEQTLTFWEIADRLTYKVNHEQVSEIMGRNAVRILLERIQKAIKQQND